MASSPVVYHATTHRDNIKQIPEQRRYTKISTIEWSHCLCCLVRLPKLTSKQDPTKRELVISRALCSNPVLFHSHATLSNGLNQH